MRFAFSCLLLAVATVFGAENAPTGTVDMSELQGQISQLIDILPPVPTDFVLPTGPATLRDDLPTPPPGLLRGIMTAVPQTVIAGLLDPAYRSSLASDFEAGKTADWFSHLPSSVREYVSLLQAQMTSAGITFDGSALETGGLLGSNGQSSSEDSEDEGSGSSSSSALASRPTGALAGGLVIAMGALGAALAL
ncbi:hypothetical protein VTO42DRAFT_6600 [Malbranchea cinnamomea]